MPAVNWEWYLGRTSDLSFIEGLQNAKSRQVSVALNDRESAGFTLSMFEKAAPSIKPVSTCLLAYRNDDLVWSGPIWTVKRDAPQMTMEVGCVGWFEFINRYLLNTGNLVPSWYGDSGVMTASTLAFTQIDQSIIAANLLQRALTDAQQGVGMVPGGAPTWVKMGNIPITGIVRNITYQEFKNIGQAIVELTAMEAGFDFRVDPATRLLNIYYNPVGPPGTTINGRGQTRQDTIFGYHWGPSNVAALSETVDASTIANEVFAVGPYGIGQGYDWGSQAQYGVFTTQASLSDVTQGNILAAYASAEAIVNAQPRTLWTFDQIALGKNPDGTLTALEPFSDFDIGDYCQLKSDYGVIVPSPESGRNLQPIRIFAFTIDIGDEGTEQVRSIQTTYQQHS